MCHTSLQIAAHYTHWCWQCLTHKHTKDCRTHHPPWAYVFVHVCCVCGRCTLPFVCARFLCGIKTSLPLRKNVYVFQNAYLKPRRGKRRRRTGKRRDRNAVGMLDETADGISGTFRHVNQIEGKKSRPCPYLRYTTNIKSVPEMCTLTPAHTMNTPCNLSTPHSLNLLPAVLLSQINLASKGGSRAPFWSKCVFAG